MDTLNYIYKRFNVKPGIGAIHISGFGRNDLAVVFKELGFTKGVEIGTETGKYAYVLCKSNPELKLTCVDPYLAYENGEGYKDLTQDKFERIYQTAKERLAPFDVSIVRAKSAEFVDKFEDNSLDFVYIDGNHRLDYVVQDLIKWTDKVKPGGIVAGHDYIKLAGQYYSHVPYAVQAYTQAYFRDSYFVMDNKDKIRSKEENKDYDRIKTWFFVK